MPTTLFVDEILRRGTHLVGVAVGTGQVGRARSIMRALLPAGARRVHFVKENYARRRRVLSAIARLDLPCVIIEAAPRRRYADERDACLSTLVAWALANDVGRIVLERDDNSVVSDRRTIAHELARAGAQDALEYDHLPAPTEPLLWIPDALAWSWTRDSEWRHAVQQMNVTVLRA